MNTYRTSHGVRLLAAATTSAVVVGLLGATPAFAAPVSAPSAVAAQQSASTVPLQLSTGTRSTLVRSLTVDASGVISYTMGAGLFSSAARFVVYIDGRYASETYAGRTYSSGVTTIGDVATVRVTPKAAAGSTVQVLLVGGAPGQSTNQSPRVLASVVAGQEVDVSLVDGRFVLTMSTALYQSATRIMARRNGTRAAESYAGSVYSASSSISGEVTKLTLATPARTGERIDVVVAPGKPGESYPESSVRTIATVAATTAANVFTDPRSSTLTIGARGDAEADRVRENRWFRHSVLEPAGRFVKKGETLTVTVPQGTEGVRVAIGQYGVYAGLNGGKDTALSLTTITSATTKIVADRDGVVSVQKAWGAPATVSLAGGVPVPNFTNGQTTRDDFLLQLQLFTDAPFAIVQGERALALFQRETLDANLAGVTAERVQSWDDVVTVIDRAYGLSLTETGLHRKSPARVLISNPDTGVGYASATADRITFQNDTGAGAALLTRSASDQWGLWHEIGHTYQTPQYRWGGQTEVTVNIASLAVQRANGWPSRLETTSTKAAIEAYLAKPDGQRNYDAESDLFVKLGLFGDLHAQLGGDVLPELNRAYREQVVNGLVLSGDESMRQHFMKTVGEVSKTNVAPLFLKWGLTPSTDTLAALAVHPDL